MIKKFLATKMQEQIYKNFSYQAMDPKCVDSIALYLRSEWNIIGTSFEKMINYYKLVNKIRQLSFMVHHDMPFQRNYHPSQRKRSKNRHMWAESLTAQELIFLNSTDYTLSANLLLQDYWSLDNRFENSPIPATPSNIYPSSTIEELKISSKLPNDYDIFLNKYENRAIAHVHVNKLDTFFQKIVNFIKNKYVEKPIDTNRYNILKLEINSTEKNYPREKILKKEICIRYLFQNWRFLSKQSCIRIPSGIWVYKGNT